MGQTRRGPQRGRALRGVQLDAGRIPADVSEIRHAHAGQCPDGAAPGEARVLLPGLPFHVPDVRAAGGRGGRARLVVRVEALASRGRGPDTALPEPWQGLAVGDRIVAGAWRFPREV